VSDSRADAGLRPLRRGDLACAVLLFGAALSARAPFIVRGETLLHSDEAIVGIMAQDVAEGRRWPIYFYGQRYMGALEAYVIAGLLPLVDDPLIALRLGPALFFAALVAAQYLMLTQWLGRGGGWTAAACLVLAAPMFVQWSVSARGGYIEVLLWGTLLLWAYSAWFARSGRGAPSAGPRLLLGLLIGSGFWVNPAIALFVAPIVVHSLFRHFVPRVRQIIWVDAVLARLGILALPAVILTGVAVVTTVYGVWVEDGRVRHQLLLDLLPRRAATAVIAAVAAVLAAFVLRRPAARGLLNRNGALVLGALAGASPAVVYAAGAMLGRHALDPSLPLGLRPLWRCGETLGYLVHGLPLLGGADVRPYLRLVGVGRDSALRPLGESASSMIAAGDWVVLAALSALALCLLVELGPQIRNLLRLDPVAQAGGFLPLIGIVCAPGLYVLGGCTMNFTTIRYLVPIWAFVPALVALACCGSESPQGRSRRRHAAARVATVALLGAWGCGQAAMFTQLGGPHPLRPVAEALTRDGTPAVFAEILDAHLLTYLTRQRCRVAEFEPFWPRLAHLRPAAASARTTPCVVEIGRTDRTEEWHAGGWPGPPPPETYRLLWPRLRAILAERPGLFMARRPLAGSYELILLREPIPERDADS